MEACLRPQISWRLINDNHKAENERFWRNRKIEKYKKYSLKNVRIVYNSLCVWGDYICVLSFADCLSDI